MKNQPIHLGISTCPNDTFAFAALMNRQVDWRGLDFTIDLLDIAELNDRLVAGEFDVCKTSFHAALSLTEQTVVLPTGSALGFGVGPLLLAARDGQQPSDQQSSDQQPSGQQSSGQQSSGQQSSGRAQITLCPGKQTTATLLFLLFYPDTTELQQTVFSDIMPRLQSGTADFGVCIHEGRFTWQQEGLFLVEDLGQRWEQETQSPLPLGGIVARRSLGDKTIQTVNEIIRDSLKFAHNNHDQVLPTMRRYAQEFDDAVLMQHVELYVNEWTLDLGEVGAKALNTLSKMAKSIGLIDKNAPPIEVMQDQS
ncbi:1,4-dihydroxy-6-naphtoate synthase [Rubripirellula obstinata]|uniref:1,4-dihydroxy-6-naphtoate synthase n=1 Tax=Rubripirellula obstinata TaxID=406547 RepID=A0A5B1CSZ0_9BACT|nr:1,4-dihydroxy-6-naphthoate synthase [Rubripirellula obstinata]KAA1262334.1 1,4-dihydroxy-6-naphtoate synthase [Rubripirellula obstinata]